MKFEIIEGIPTWAASYLVNNDPSGLEDEDIKLVDKFCDELFKEGYRLVCPEWEKEPYFTWHPAFGLASEVQDWFAEVLDDDDYYTPVEDSDDSSDAVQN